MSQPIGIFGGTFDPIHIGHLRTALELFSIVDFKEIRFMPCYEPVHKTKPLASPADRFAMVKLATADIGPFIADDTEIIRGGPSYMVDTLATLRKKFTHDPLCLIVGIDAFAHFHTWHRYEDILSLSHIVIADRPPYALNKTDMAAALQADHETFDPLLLHQTYSGKIYRVRVTPLDISATKIRQIIAQGSDPKYLIPEQVTQYIQQHGVYTSARL